MFFYSYFIPIGITWGEYGWYREGFWLKKWFSVWFSLWSHAYTARVSCTFFFLATTVPVLYRNIIDTPILVGSESVFHNWLFVMLEFHWFGWKEKFCVADWWKRIFTKGCIFCRIKHGNYRRSKYPFCFQLIGPNIELFGPTKGNQVFAWKTKKY